MQSVAESFPWNCPRCCRALCSHNEAHVNAVGEPCLPPEDYTSRDMYGHRLVVKEYVIYPAKRTYFQNGHWASRDINVVMHRGAWYHSNVTFKTVEDIVALNNLVEPHEFAWDFNEMRRSGELQQDSNKHVWTWKKSG